MNQINLFRRAPDVLSFAAAETIFRQGDPGDLMYIITAGEVEILIDGVAVATRSAGHLIGEMAFLDGHPRSATVVARTDCALAPISQRNFQFLLDDTPHFATQALRQLVERLREVQHPSAALRS